MRQYVDSAVKAMMNSKLVDLVYSPSTACMWYVLCIIHDKFRYGEAVVDKDKKSTSIYDAYF